MTTTKTIELTLAQRADIKRRREEDFDFRILCYSKGNPGMYELLRDRGLDQYKDVDLTTPAHEDK